MKNEDARVLIEELAHLPVGRPSEAEHALAEVYQALLEGEGYQVDYRHGPGDRGIDILATSANSILGVQVKSQIRPCTRGEVAETIGNAIVGGYSRFHLVSISGFNRDAVSAAQLAGPVSLQLLDLNELRRWAVRLCNPEAPLTAIDILDRASRELAIAIANNPRELDSLEWRDLERVVATALEGVGFGVRLTPASKDGGKDVIVECTIGGEKQSFIIELKHWRSGQRVGSSTVKHFVQVVVSESRTAGLFISSSGFNRPVIEKMVEFQRQNVYLRSEQKLVTICQEYTRRRNGVWVQSTNLPQLLLA